MAVIAVVLVAVVAVVGAGAFVLSRRSGPSLKGLTATEILTKSLAAARTRGSVHVTGTFNDGGTPQQGAIDIGPNGGSESVSSNGETAKMLLVNGQLYFQANAAYWTDLFDTPSTFAAQYDSKWIIFPAGDADFKQAGELLKMPAIIDQLLALSGNLTKVENSAMNQVQIFGTVPSNDFTKDNGAGDRAVVTISSKAPFLPVSISFSDPGNGQTAMTFSGWGEKVTLTPPGSAVPFPTIVPTGGPGVSTQ